MKKIYPAAQEGLFYLGDMTNEDLQELLNMIDSAKLLERRSWHPIKEQIKELLKDS